MIRVVLDANVLVSGLISRKGPPGQILDSWLEGRFELCVSQKILKELKRVLQYSRIQERLMEGQAAVLLKQLDAAANITAGTLTLDVLTRDPSDNIYLACAVEAQAAYLVTGNSGHFDEVGANYQGISILTPRMFLEIMQRT